MARLTPEQRAKMLREAEKSFRARGLTGHQAKAAAREALRRFMDDVNEDEVKERAEQKAANN